jgi:hypothetical protein
MKAQKYILKPSEVSDDDLLTEFVDTARLIRNFGPSRFTKQKLRAIVAELSRRGMLPS